MSTYESQDTANMESYTLKVQNNKLQIQAEQKHFFDMSKYCSKLTAVQVIEILFQQTGL